MTVQKPQAKPTSGTPEWLTPAYAGRILSGIRFPGDSPPPAASAPAAPQGEAT
ncbi:hypothetical protein [Acetobacter okinawensis]|uniref:hypothetical protein n=1 Tax=Acetobacter okinawensis TaxID=1076594 RepID=UPI000A50313F|nr:hypothetical protein [Acetobacter okinawensis]